MDCVGLALRYCVSFSARDARAEVYNGKPWHVRIVEDACRAIVFEEGDYEAEIDALYADGIEIVRSLDVLAADEAELIAVS